MYSDWAVTAGVATAVFLWLGILTYFIWKQKNFLNSLFPKSGGRDIRVKFEEVINKVGQFDQDLRGLDEKLDSFDKASLGHIQRKALLRYNPYDNTGGNISFSLALLDLKGTGIILTSLHSRSETRVYAKEIVLGKGKHELSKEEGQVLKEALNE